MQNNTTTVTAEGNAPRRFYVLTDGVDTANRRRFTDAELEQEQVKARQMTGGNWSWVLDRLQVVHRPSFASVPPIEVRPRINAATMSVVRNTLMGARNDLQHSLDKRTIPYTKARRAQIAKAIVQLNHAIKNLG